MSCTKSNCRKNFLVHHLLHLLLLLLLLHSTEAAKKGFDILQCESALGMQNGLIEDADITASSSFDNRRRGPTNARIRTEKGDGAWCPKSPISPDSYEYLEVDLRQLKVITLVETQGRFENGQGTEHADQYRLEYQREDGGTWFRYKNRRGQETIQGNSNTYIAEIRDIVPLIVGRRIRFVPVSSHPRNVCLRVELYGCSFPDGMISYEMPQGHRYGPDLDLADRFYDGIVGDDGVLRDGLGLLTDGAEGQANFQLDESDAGVRSFQWIGWKNDSLLSAAAVPLSVVFEFDAVRNFSMLYVRSNNMFSKGVHVFRLARVYFGLDDRNFARQSQVQYSYARDNQAEYARTVKIPLENNVGRYVKLELLFDAKWIMISEVHFESEYVTADVIGRDVEEEGRHDSVHHVTSSPSHVTRVSGFLEIKNDDVTRRSPDHRRLITPPPSPKGNDVIYVKDWTKKSFNTENSPPGSTSTDSAGLWNRPGFRNGLDYGSVVVMIIVLAVLSLVLCSVLVLIFHRRHRLSCIPGLCSSAAKSSSILANPPSTCSISRPSSLLYPSSYLIHSTSSSYRPPAFPVPSSSSSAYHADDPSQSTASDFLISPTTVASPYATVDLPPPPPSGERLLTEIASDESSSSSSLDGIYSTPASLQLLQQAVPTSMINIPRGSLKYVKSLGEGHFGQVYVCEVLDTCASESGKFGSRLIVDKFSSLVGSTVSVKVLQHNASEFKRSLFEREMTKSSRLVDPNIASMLMFYTDQEPFCIVLEYSPLGDLKSFLRQRGAELAGRDGRAPGSCDLLSYGCLVFFASQIASGMKHFEELGLVHRDLSARNCIVSENLTVKISDLGVGHHLYPEDYSTCAGQVVLPIRWMAWESVLMGSFSVKSDVWSFGVTVWEILTLAVELPYADLTDDAVIDNCHNISSSSSSSSSREGATVAADAVRLGQPARCPRELYDLLCHCWARDEALRPTFREVHMFLRMKSAGFNPKTETLLYRP